MIPGLLLYAVLVMPPVAAWLEGSMVGHMLIQIPLLALAGGSSRAGRSAADEPCSPGSTPAASPDCSLPCSRPPSGCCRGCSTRRCAARW